MRDRHFPLLTLGALGALAPAFALGVFGRAHPAGMSVELHFYGVGVAALCATAAAVALTVAGARSGDARAVVVGTAFSVMAALLALHGLATPGIFLGPNGLGALTGGATLPAGGALLALASLPALRGPRGVRPLIVLEGALLAAVAAAGGIGFANPGLVPAVPAAASPLALALLVVGLGFYGALGLRALRTVLLTRRRSDVLVLVGLVWLAAALVGALTLDYRALGWWLGHGYELVGIALVGAPVALDLHRSVQSRPLYGDLRGGELVADEEHFLGSHVRSLTVRLAEKDEYTEEHVRRVALRAVQVGEELGLAPGRLRQLALGGLVHDIGKLAVPDRILKKPGALDDEEFSVIRRHPAWGLRLLRELGGFPDPVLRLVRDHHERLDGSGYPGGRAAGELDLDTRILAVCDVYDALISPRVYRPAWTHERAVLLLREGAGRAFDPRCVTALERVLAREHAASLAVAS